MKIHVKQKQNLQNRWEVTKLIANSIGCNWFVWVVHWMEGGQNTWILQHDSAPLHVAVGNTQMGNTQMGSLTSNAVFSFWLSFVSINGSWPVWTAVNIVNHFFSKQTLKLTKERKLLIPTHKPLLLPIDRSLQTKHFIQKVCTVHDNDKIGQNWKITEFTNGRCFLSTKTYTQCELKMPF